MVIREAIVQGNEVDYFEIVDGDKNHECYCERAFDIRIKKIYIMMMIEGWQ